MPRSHSKLVLERPELGTLPPRRVPAQQFLQGPASLATPSGRTSCGLLTLGDQRWDLQGPHMNPHQRQTITLT